MIWHLEEGGGCPGGGGGAAARGAALGERTYSSTGAAQVGKGGAERGRACVASYLALDGARLPPAAGGVAIGIL